MLTSEIREAAAVAHGSDVQAFPEALWTGEGELLRLIRALRMIRYGSITLTLHDGRIVEIHKTERIRRNGNKGTSGSASHE